VKRQVKTLEKKRINALTFVLWLGALQCTRDCALMPMFKHRPQARAKLSGDCTRPQKQRMGHRTKSKGGQKVLKQSRVLREVHMPISRTVTLDGS